MNRTRLVLVGLTILLGLGVALEAQAQSIPEIAPISSIPAGQTYGRWAAEWWQWAFGVPAERNPILDTTGEFCAERQVDEVWFLAGSFSSDPVVRACQVPAGKSLLFPLININ